MFSQCEKHRWKMDEDVAWSSIQHDLVSAEELQTLRLAALTEGFTPTYIADLLDLYCDDAEMGAFLSIQYYEEYKHFHALRRYLRLNGAEITDDELMARRSTRTSYRSKLIPLLKFGLSEIFTATTDLVSEFPAYAARRLGFGEVPLLCARELEIDGAMPRVVRMLAHVETDLPRADITHVYLHGAARLRRDLTRVREVPDA